jgi:hypothetical protein
VKDLVMKLAHDQREAIDRKNSIEIPGPPD